MIEWKCGQPLRHKRGCLMERIVSLEEQIRKFFFEKHLDFWQAYHSGERKRSLWPLRKVLQSLPEQAGAYLLMDSWYTNSDILDECRKRLSLDWSSENQPDPVSKRAKNVRHGLRLLPFPQSFPPCNGERPRVLGASLWGPATQMLRGHTVINLLWRW